MNGNIFGGKNTLQRSNRKGEMLSRRIVFRRENNNDERNTLERKIFLRRIILIREEILCMGMYLKEENTLQRGTRKGKIH